MPHYDAALTLRDARGRYFAANGLGERGYQDAWVRLALDRAPPSASLSDQLHFAGWSAAALALAAASAAPLWLVAWAIGAHFW